MIYRTRGFRHGVIKALNRCVAATFFTALKKSGCRFKEHDFPAREISPQMMKSIAMERYLAIPTFIRQGKTLGL